MLLVHASELLSAFIALEIASLSLYVMIGFQKVHDKRVEAEEFSIPRVRLFGGHLLSFRQCVCVCGAGYDDLGRDGNRLDTLMGKDVSLVIIGATLILATFLFKISAFPFQNWTIDVYDGSSLPVSAFMATFKVAIFGFILRLMLVDFDPIRDTWDTLFIVVIIATLLYGSFLAIIQKSLKRMLAASSIVHTGYLLIAFVSIGYAGESAASSIIYYLVAYFLSAMGAFGLISYIAADEHVRVTYEDFRGFAHVHPYMAAMLSVFMLSLAGIPSTIGFLWVNFIFLPERSKRVIPFLPYAAWWRRLYRCIITLN